MGKQVTATSLRAVDKRGDVESAKTKDRVGIAIKSSQYNCLALSNFQEGHDRLATCYAATLAHDEPVQVESCQTGEG